MTSETGHRQFLAEGPSLAILASTVILPGVGQFMQKRWIAGCLFMFTFCAAAGMLLHAVLHPVLVNLMEVFKQNPELIEVRWGLIMIYGAISALIFALNLIDAWRAARRSRSGEADRHPDSNRA